MKELIYPKQIILEVTNRCQLACKGCPTNDPDFPKGDMSYGMILRILDQVEYLATKKNTAVTVIPWMNGEPLLYKDYAEVIRHITRRNIPSYITTNGMIWNEELVDLLTDPRGTSCYQIIFSLDGLWEKSAVAARPGTDFRRVCDNIEDFLNEKRTRGGKIDVAVKLCRRGQDWNEVEYYISHWLRKEGISYVCVGDMLETVNPVSMRQYPCEYFDNRFMVVRWDGTLVPCAYNPEMANENAYPMGNIEDYDCNIELAYNSSAYGHLRSLQLNGVYHPVCDACGFAYCGSGFKGEVTFRNPDLIQEKIHFHRDYYNSFFSLESKEKPNRYYNFRGGERCLEKSSADLY